MNSQQAALLKEFEAKLKADDNDETTHLVFADFLEDLGREKEALKHRRWKEIQGYYAILKKDEDNAVVRSNLVQALEETAQDDEAERQRKWPVAKKWLVEFCESYNPARYEPDPYEWDITYETLLKLGKEAYDEWSGEDSDPYFSCGSNQTMQGALYEHKLEFWTNWSIVTGNPLPEGFIEKTGFGCSC